MRVPTPSHLKGPGMTRLENPRHEHFAQLRAEGLTLEDAYERAGFTPARGHASRLAAREDVAERIAELRKLQTDADLAERPKAIAMLMRFAEASMAFGTAAGVKEARLALLDAERLQRELAQDRMKDRQQMMNDKAAEEAKALHEQYQREQAARSAALRSAVLTHPTTRQPHAPY